ncbi:MAG: MMPL family transporter, partial [Tumebacillaceae bacterium]
MIEKWIRGLARARWFVVLLWVALTVGSVFALPNLTEIAKQTDTKFIPSDFDSVQANDLLSKISVDDKSKSNAILVLHRDGGLQEADNQWMENKVKELTRDKDALGILTVQSAYDNPNLKDTFQSKDKTTEIAAIGLPKADASGVTQDSVDQIRKRITGAPSGTETSLTGSAPINKDYTATSEEGLKKTEVLTVVLVLVILLGVFRSPIAPLIPLVTIAMSFLFARGFVAWGTYFGLPVSSFTETFLVAVLFGAGTDYCILMIHRFREELGNGLERVDAMIRTMQTVGKTVVFSASTVLIAFFLLGFAKFGLYQSAVGVSIGMLMTLLAGLTLAPALMLILGPKLFWPFKIKPGHAHGDSKFWGMLAGLVSRRPLAVLLITVLVMSPLMLLFKGERSFDNLTEIDPTISSVQGFRTVQKAFSDGEIMPITFTLSSTNSMRTTEGLAALEKASAAAAQLQNVSAVRSAARPLGKQLEELTIPKILDKTTDGIGQAKLGVTQVSDGLGTLQSKMQEGVSGVGQIHTGLDTIASKQREVATGTAQMAQGTSQIAAGLSQGANQLKDNAKDVQKLQDGLNQLAGA